MDSLIPDDDEPETTRTIIPEDDDDEPEVVAPRRAKGAPRKRISEASHRRITELANSFSAPATAPKAEAAPKSIGLGGTIKEGFKSTARALGATIDTYQGDEAEVVEASKAQQAAAKDPRLASFLAAIVDHKRRLGPDPSLWESIKAVGSAAVDNPAGAGLMVAEQIPNSLAALGAGGAGALAGGAVAGPVGAVVGGLAGLTGANIGLETGHKALEAGATGSFGPEEQDRVKGEGAKKGFVVSGVDTLTLGATKFITGASRRAVEAATKKTLTDKGVDVADAAAVKTAMADPAVMASVNEARKLAADASSTLGKKIAQTGGALALETIGEGVGEYVGEFAATGKADMVDAVLESISSLSQSMGEIAYTSALNKRAENRLFDTEQDAAKAARKDTDNTGVKYEVKPHPVEPEKFVAVPKSRTGDGVEVDRDETGEIIPKAPDPSTPAPKRDETLRKNVEAFAKNPDVVPGADNPAPLPTPSQSLDSILNPGATKPQKHVKAVNVPKPTPAPVKPATAVKTAKPVKAEAPKPIKPAETPKSPEVKKPEVAKPAKSAAPKAPVEPAPPAPAPKPDAKLPQHLGGAKPNYSYGAKRFALKFESDVDRAAYIAAQPVPSKRDAEYVKFVVDSHGITEADVRAHGAKVRQSIKNMARDADAGELTIASHSLGKNELPKTAPTAQPATAPEISTPKKGEDQATSGSSTEDPEVRALVDRLIKRTGYSDGHKRKPFNKAKEAAVAFLKGEDVLPARFGSAAAILSHDPVAVEILNNLHARAQAKKAAKPKQKPTNQKEKQNGNPEAETKGTTETAKPVQGKVEKVANAPSRDYDGANGKPKEKESAPGPVRGGSRSVPSERGGRILANGIAESIQKHGVSALIGKSVNSPEKLAELAQIYRNPQYETFRIFFTKGNKVVHASGITSRLPGNTPIFPDNKGFAEGAAWMKSMMQSSGADGYWMLHNHPSGNPTPSDPDVAVTKVLAKILPGFKGHVIINSNKFGQIMIPRTNAVAKVTERHFAEDMLLKASKPSPYIGRMVHSPIAVASIGKSFQKEGWVTLVGVAGVTGVRSIGEIPVTTFTSPMLAKAAIRRFARRTGSGSIFAYGTAADMTAGNVTHLISEGFLRGATDEKLTNYTGQKTGKSFGNVAGTGGAEVKQATAAFNPQTPPTPTPLRSRMEKIADTLIYNFQDRFKPLKDIQSRAGAITEDEDAALAEERYSGMVRARTDNFEEQLRDPLLKAIHDSGVSYEDVESYLHALHAPSRNAAMQEINPTEAELKSQTDALAKERDSLANDADVKEYLKLRKELRGAEADIEDGIADESLATMIKSEIARLKKLDTVKDYAQAVDKLRALRLVKPFNGDNTALSGMSNAESEAILAKIDANGSRKALDKISSIVDTITSSTRQIYVDSGLEKADAIEAWNKKYQHYVPLHRDEVSGEAMPKTGQGFNIRGKESKRATGSNKEVTNILAHVVAQHEAAIIRSEKSRVDRALFKFAQLHPDPELWTLDVTPMLRVVDPTSGLVVERVDPTYKNKAEVLTLKIDGEEHTITFNEKNQEGMRLVASMKNMSSEQMGEVTAMVGKFTRFLATMNTTMNPVFTARNFLRDLQTAFVNLSDTAIADKKKEVFKNVGPAIKGMWDLSKGKHNSKWAKYAEEFKNAGGQTGWMEHYKDIGARADTLKKELGVMGPGKMNSTRRTINSLLEVIQDANNAVENGVRLSAYVSARKNGMTEGKAAQLAKNLTVNFNTHGAKGVELNAWYMFLNASIQGTARLVKALSNRQVQKIVSGVVLSGFLLDILARSMAGDDDEDGENDYDQLPEHTKAMNFVFMVDGRPVTIPMPYGYNFFAATGRKMSEMIFRENHSPVKSAADLAGIFLDAFSPTGQAGSGLQYLAPTVVDPFVQWSENKNFAGNPLRRAQNPFGVPNPEYQMGFKSTSAPAKWMAEILNDGTGGNEVRPGFVNVNPAFFDFAVSSVFGGAGRTLLQTASAPIKAIGDDEIQAREIPFANIFVGAKPEHQTERKYFEAAKKVELVKKELKKYEGDQDMIRQIREEHADEISLIKAAEKTKKLLTRLTKREATIDKTAPENKRELKKAIEDRRKTIMSEFNRRHQAAMAE